MTLGELMTPFMRLSNNMHAEALVKTMGAVGKATGSWSAGNADRFVGSTLRSRMRNNPAANNLHGKTGSLTGVTALSGYVSTKDGRKLAFSMISNHYLISPRSIEDAGGVTLASWTDQAPAAIKPDTTPRAQAADGCSDWDKSC